MAPRTAAPARRRPLVITDDPELLDDLLRIAAAAGAEVDVAPDPAAARSRYPTAPIVLVGVGSAVACARAGLPRRPGLVLVGRAGEGDPPWEFAEWIGADHVALLPAAEPWLSDRFSGGVPGPPATGRVVTVIGGRGGAGASVLAAGLAVTAARAGQRALLVDADPLGGGVDLVLGWESIDGLRWPAFSQTRGPISPPVLDDVLPSRGELSLLSWDRGEPLSSSMEAMSAALDAGRRGHQLVVVDLPRRLDAAAALALAAADLAILVVPAELRACAAASRVAAEAAEYTKALALVVRGPAPGRLKAGDVAEALRLPVLGTLRPEPGIARGLERGEPPAGDGRGPLAGLCRRVLADLGIKQRFAA